MILYNSHISGSLEVQNGITGSINSASYSITSSYSLNSGGTTYTVYDNYSDIINNSPANNLDVAYCSESADYYLGINNTWRSLHSLKTDDITFDTTGMVLWLTTRDSNFITLQPTSNDMKSWLDLSPTNASMSFPAGKNPQYLTSSLQNGIGSIYFSGTDMLVTNKTINNVSMSVIFVAKFDTDVPGNYGGVLTHNVNNGGAGNTFRYTWVGYEGSKATTFYSGDGTNFSGYTTASNHAQEITRLNTYIRGGDKVIMYTNGYQAYSASATLYTSSCNLSIADAGYRPFAGHLYEIMVYETAILDSNRQLIESYLNSKWAIY